MLVNYYQSESHAARVLYTNGYNFEARHVARRRKNGRVIVARGCNEGSQYRVEYKEMSNA